MKKNIKIIIIIIAGLGLMSALTWMFAKMLQPKTAYVDLVMVYNDFKLKQELDSKLQNVQLKRKGIMDSLELQLNALGQKVQRMQNDTASQIYFSQKRQQYIYQQQQYEQDNNNTAQQYQDQIWKQLNQYIRDYGKEHNYVYVFGGEGSGAVMYADDAHDITNAVKEFVNNRYKGS